jgi:hypothetical protein
MNLICKANKAIILKQLMKKGGDLDQPSWYSQLLFLFKNKKEVYDTALRVGAPYLLEHISEEYPINQHNKLLISFSKMLADDWKKYIHISPEIVLLIVAHYCKNMSKSELKLLKQKVPKKLLEQIKEFELDWFNTTNNFASVIYTSFL